jgi:LDH2 family malate/lactate/ureidoglycolate dehydrogenase
MTSAYVYRRAELQHFAAGVFETTGLRRADAWILADSLVDADERGIVTHGLVRLPAYWGQLRSGQVNPQAQVTVQVDRGAVALLNADGGFGAPAGTVAMTTAVQRAREFGIGMAGVRNMAHFGAASYYARIGAAAGCYAIAMTSTSAVVAPWGGRQARVGNNPLAIAVPALPGKTPFVLDIAMSAVSRGRIKLAYERAEELASGWALDGNGNPTTNPAEALLGALLPAGGHKGSGLAIAIEMLAAALTGAQLSQDVLHSGFTSAADGPDEAQPRPDTRPDVTVGSLYLAIDAGSFGDPYGVMRRNQQVLDFVQSSLPAAGTERVLIPGELEYQTTAAMPAAHVVVVAETAQAITEVAAASGIAAPTPAEHESQVHDG